MFGEDEAVDFLERDCGMEDVRKRPQADPKGLLGEIILQIHAKVPFQTLNLCSWLFVPRVLPNVEKASKDCFSGNGGNCTYINVFVSCLLEAIGYSVHLCVATVTNTVVNSYLIILVDDLENKSDLHLVDCGLGLPSLCTIPLNFHQESPVYHDSFLEYKVVHRSGQILRMHGRGDIILHLILL